MFHGVFLSKWLWRFTLPFTPSSPAAGVEPQRLYSERNQEIIKLLFCLGGGLILEGRKVVCSAMAQLFRSSNQIAVRNFALPEALAIWRRQAFLEGKKSRHFLKASVSAREERVYHTQPVWYKLLLHKHDLYQHKFNWHIITVKQKMY